MDLLTLVRTNLLTMVVLLAFSVLLSDTSPWFAGFGLLIAYGWVYLVHRCIHLLPTSGPISYLNLHVLVHHRHDAEIDPVLGLSIEAITNLAMNLSLLVVQGALGLSLAPTSVVVFYALLYTSVHIFNYSLVGNDTHRNHHRNTTTNYGPDTLDHLFGTSADDVWEDLTPITLNACGVALVTLGLKYVLQWKD